MPKKKIKRRKAQNQGELKETLVVIKVKEEPRRFLICEYCGHKQYEAHSRESGTAWCQECGRAFEVRWKS